MYLLYIIPKVCVLQRTCDAGYFQHKIIIFCSVLVYFYGNGCNSMAPNGIETHHYHTTAPVDCQIEFLSSRARIWLYPFRDQTTRKSTHLFNCG